MCFGNLRDDIYSLVHLPSVVVAKVVAKNIAITAVHKKM